MNSSRRKGISASLRESILELYDYTCVYCSFPATCCDHVIPVAYLGLDSGVNRKDNLVASCTRCNLIAGDKVFPDFDSKRDYVLGKRRPEILRDTGCMPT